jgi:hypothetical protein
MSDSARLEREYRRLLAWYPVVFRRENEQEILAVLMAGAEQGQRRPGLAESADLIRSALGKRLRPGPSRPPSTVLAAIRLMYAGAVLELAALFTILATTGDIRSAILQRNPGYTAAQWHSVWRTHLVPDEFAVPIAIILWLFMAWTTGNGYSWARVVLAVFFGLSTLSLLVALADGAAVYATADLIAGAVLCAVEVSALVLVFNKQSDPFFRPERVHA